MNRISSFIQFDPREKFEREYFIAHTSMKRFRLPNILAILVGLLFFLIPGLILLVYFSFRKLKISYGYATITNKRILYYEYNPHEAENYHAVKSLYLADVTAAQFRVERTWLRKSFYMAMFAEFKALAVGGESWLGFLGILGKSGYLEPGPDALEFIQYVSGQVALRKFQPEWSSQAGTA